MATIKVKNLTFYYDGSFDTIFKEVNLEIDTKWKLGFCGRNGRGKTTFMKLLMGEFEYRGQIEELLFDYQPTMIFVEHDVVFVENIANEVVRLCEDN